MYYDNTFQNIPLFMEQQANNTIFQTAFGNQRLRAMEFPASLVLPSPIGMSSTARFR